MPRIVMGRDKEVIPDELAVQVRSLLRHIVALELTCRDFDGQLDPKDTEVRVEDFGLLDENGSHKLTVDIWATEFPDRRRNLDERRTKIQEALRQFLDQCGRQDVHGYVYVLLSPASFGEF